MTDGLRAIALVSVVLFATVASAPLTGVASAAGNQGCQTVSAPVTITESGCYALSGSVTIGSGDGITIAASNVVLDGRGHTLSGNVVGDGVVVHNASATLVNVTVNNLTLSGWRHGVRYERVDGGRIATVTVRDSQGGIVLVSDSFDWGTDSNGVTRNVVVDDSDLSDSNVGVLVESSDDNEIRDTVVDGNSINGIQLGYTRDTVVSNVTATGNGENGIEVGDSSGATVANSTATANGEEGVWLGGSSGTTVKDTTASTNGFGIHLGDADGNTIRSNELRNNREGGINVYNSGSNTIYDNLFENTDNVDFDPPHQTNAWNVAETAGTNVLGGTTVGGNYWANPDGTGFSQTCTDADSDGICDSSFTVNDSQVDASPLSDEYVANGDPTASFTHSPSSPTPGATVSFDAAASADSDGSVVGYAWDFDGDGTTDATGRMATHTFPATGDYDLTLEVTDDRGGTDEVTKTVSVVPAEPEITVSTEYADVGDVPNGTSKTTPVVVSNAGTAPLSVTSTALGGPDAESFSLAGGGSFVLGPGQSRTLSVTFTPASIRPHAADLTVLSNDTDESTALVKLRGTGVGRDPALTITPHRLDFPDTYAGDAVTRQFTVENTGNVDTEIRGYDFTGDTVAGSYDVPDGNEVLAPGESFTGTVTFEPSNAGPYRFVLHVTNNGTGDHSVIGTGNGRLRNRTIDVSPHRVDFPDTFAGETVTRQFTVTNEGNGNVDIRGYDLTGDTVAGSYDVPEEVGVLAPGESYTGNVTFEPLNAGPYRFVLHVTHNGTGDSSVIATGNGRLRDRTVDVTPHRIHFPDTHTGDTVTRQFTVTNEGTGTVDVAGYDLTGDYAVASYDVPENVDVLAPGESYTGNVTFEPSTPGDYRFVLHVTHNGTGDSAVIGTGTGTGSPGGGGGSSSGPSDDEANDDGAGDDGDANGTAITVLRGSRWTNLIVVPTSSNESLSITVGDDNGTTADDDGNGSDARLLGMNVTTDADGSMRFNVTSEDEPSENTTDFRASVGGDALGYLRIDHSIPDEDVSGVALDFFVSADRLAAFGVAPDDVSLYRYHDGAWTELPTRLVQSEDGGYVMRADSPGLSTFAVARSSTAGPAATPAGDTTETVTPVGDGTSVTESSPTEAVASATLSPEPTAATTDGSGPGFGPTRLVVAVGVLLAFVRRRR